MRGLTDYVFDSERGCRVVNELPNSAGGEGITYVDRVAQLPSQSLPPLPPSAPPAAPPSTPPASPPLPACPLGDVCTTGPCLITDGGSCATSPDFPNDYPSNESCTIYGLPPVGLDVIAFDVEGGGPGRRLSARAHVKAPEPKHGRQLGHCESQGFCGYCPQCPTCDGSSSCDTCCEIPECPYDYLTVNGVR